MMFPGTNRGGGEYSYVNRANPPRPPPKMDMRFYKRDEDSTFHKLLLTAVCFCAGILFALVWYNYHAPPLPEEPEYGILEPMKSLFQYKETIAIQFANQDPEPTDWIGIFKPHDYTNRSVLWQYACGGIEPCYSKGRPEQVFGGELHFDATNALYSDYNLTWPLCSGQYKACLVTVVLEGVFSRNETLACSDAFTVGGDGPCTGFNGGGRRRTLLRAAGEEQQQLS
jgi:hypothetical protein